MRQFNKLKNLKTLVALLLICYSSSAVFAQVSGISYTISPAAEYNWWDDKSGLDNGLMIGGKLGIGFGEFIELRGIYMQSVNQETNFADFGLANFNEDLFTSRDVDVKRYGAELRANLGSGKFLPYITLGSGIQSMEVDSFAKNESIYISGGIGLKFNLGDRFTFNIEGKNTPYNFSAARNFLNDEERALYQVSGDDLLNDQLRRNWSLNASVQIYLGGRKPGSLTDLDKAYMSTFSGGLRGLRIPIEPSLAKVNFNNDLGYRDAWMVGGYAGLDFNQYVGIRGFYFRAMENDELTTDLDDLSMYGGELRLKLNAGTGLTPYVILGGGYIDVKNKYVPNDFRVAEDQGFATGGLGITIPVSKRFNVFGSARALLTTGQSVEDLQLVDEIKTSYMYGAGLRFIIGKKSNSGAVLETTINNRVDAALAIQQKKNEEKSKELKTKYETKVAELEAELNAAYEAEDVERAAAILAEKEQNEAIVAELKSREAAKTAALEQTIALKEANLDSLKKDYEGQIITLEGKLNSAYDNKDMDTAADLMKEKEVTQKSLEDINTAKAKRDAEAPVSVPVAYNNTNTSAPQQQSGGISIVPSTSRLQMTPAEFENLIEEILENMAMPAQGGMYNTPSAQQYLNYQNTAPAQGQQDMNTRIDNIEKLLVKMNEAKAQEAKIQASTADSIKMNNQREMNQYSEKILLEIQKLNTKIDANNQEIQGLKVKTQTKKEAKRSKKEMEKLAKEAAEKAKKEKKEIKEEVEKVIEEVEEGGGN